MDIKELEIKIKAARVAYYETGEPIMEDAEFDMLEDQLRAVDPSNSLLTSVGSADNILAKAAHTIPMGSLNKAMNQNELIAWTQKHSGPYVISQKLDGCSISLEYKNGNLYRAVTRGDGIQGEDITHNAVKFDIPTKNVKLIDTPFSGTVRGEVILSTANWKEVDPDQTSNPRNLGTGLAKRKTDENNEASYLTVYGFRVYDTSGAELGKTELEMHAVICALGFKTSPIFLCSTVSELWEIVKKIEDARSTLPYWIDGMVVSVNDISYQHQFEDKRKPDWSTAVKFAPRVYHTVLRSVDFTVGHTGKIVPVGRFDSVFIDGSNVSSALLCNFDVIRNLDIAIGDTVEIYKAGDIIPRVLRVVKRSDTRVIIEEPKVCPICGSPVSRRINASGLASADLFCTNEDCKSKTLGKLKRFIHSLDIKELGHSTLLALVASGKVNDAADLYLLTVESIESAVTESGKRVGASTAKKIVKNISEKKAFTLPQLLGSIGVDGLGKGRVENIIEALPDAFASVDDWFAGKLYDSTIAAAAGVPSTGAAIQDGLNRKKELVYRILGIDGVSIAKPVEKKAGAKTFTITGTLSRGRKEIAADIEKAGHVFDGGVYAGLDYLVMEDPSSDSSKAVKARKLGIKCISEKELYDILSK